MKKNILVFLHAIGFDMAPCRARINDPKLKFTSQETKDLNAVYDLVEVGKLRQACRLMQKWPHGQAEFLDMPVEEVCRIAYCGEDIMTPEQALKRLQKYFAKRTKTCSK